MKNILKWAVNRIQKLDDLTSKSMAFIWVKPVIKDDLDETHRKIIEKLVEKLAVKNKLRREELNDLLKHLAEDNNVKYSAFMKNLRTVLSGLKVSFIAG